MVERLRMYKRFDFGKFTENQEGCKGRLKKSQKVSFVEIHLR